MSQRPALRRTIHAASVSILAVGWLWGWESFRWFATGLFVAAGITEIVRLNSPRFAAAVASLVPVFRTDESRRPTGAFWLAAGYAIASWFPHPVPMVAILVTGLGDPAAALVGSSVAPASAATGRKTWPGTGAMLAVGTVVGAAVGLHLLVALSLGVLAAALERWHGPVDDNVVVTVGVVAFLSAVS